MRRRASAWEAGGDLPAGPAGPRAGPGAVVNPCLLVVEGSQLDVTGWLSLETTLGIDAAQ